LFVGRENDFFQINPADEYQRALLSVNKKWGIINTFCPIEWLSSFGIIGPIIRIIDYTVRKFEWEDFM
jgi:hypothetical protein